MRDRLGDVHELGDAQGGECPAGRHVGEQVGELGQIDVAEGADEGEGDEGDEPYRCDRLGRHPSELGGLGRLHFGSAGQRRSELSQIDIGGLDASP